MKSVVCIADTDYEHIPNIDQFATWVSCTIETICKSPPKPESVVIKLVNEEESTQLNLRWRNCNKATNVLAFPAGKMSTQATDFIGDLAICVPIMVKQAKDKNLTLINHWAHIVIHGTLHLLGFDHLTDNEAIEMESLETHIMNKLGLPSPY